MSDGLLSIKERKKSDEFIAMQRKQQKSEKFNPYRYSSPNFVNSSVSVWKKKYIRYLLINIHLSEWSCYQSFNKTTFKAIW